MVQNLLSNVYVKVLIVILVIFSVANGLFLDFFVFKKTNNTPVAMQQSPGMNTDAQPQTQTTNQTITQQTTQQAIPQNCNADCQTKIYQATTSSAFRNAVLQLAKTVVPSQAPSQLAQSAPAQTQTTNTNSVKDFIIPLGTGTVQSTTWTNVPGVAAYVDPSQYGNIKSVVFEASINVPNSPQNVSVQLYDMNNQHPVWNSTVTLSSSNTSGMLISSPITLDTGNNLYQVQMMTQLPAPAQLVSSRIHITTY